MFPVCEKFGNNRRPPCPAAGASPSPFSLFSLLLPHFRVFLAEGSCRTSPPWPESRGWDSSTPARFPNQSSFPAVPPTRSARSFFSCSRAALAQFYHLHICAPAAPTPSGINRPREGIIRVMLNCCHTPGLPPCLINSSNYSVPPRHFPTWAARLAHLQGHPGVPWSPPHSQSGSGATCRDQGREVARTSG